MSDTAYWQRLDKDKKPIGDPVPVASDELIGKAADLYAEDDSGDGREIQIDSDAAVSEADEHDFVMAWVYVPHEEADEEEEIDTCGSNPSGSSTSDRSRT